MPLQRITSEAIKDGSILNQDVSLSAHSKTTITSASTINIASYPSDYLYVSHTSGNVAISSFGAPSSSGQTATVSFNIVAGNLTITNSSSVKCPNSANINVASGDWMIVKHEGSGVWSIIYYVKANGQLLIPIEYSSFSDDNKFSLTAFRNKLVNGSMGVWQRGTTFTPAASTLTYTADRWCTLRNTSANYTVSKGTTSGLNHGSYGTIEGSNTIIVQRNNGTSQTDQIILSQSLEAEEARKLTNRYVTLSFYARKGINYSATGNTLNVYIKAGTTGDKNVVTTLVGEVILANTSVTLNSDGTWARYTATTSTKVPADYLSLGVMFVFAPTGTAGSADQFEITGVQLEQGRVATPVEKRSFAHELNESMRFYENNYPHLITPNTNSGTNGTHVFIALNSTDSYDFGRITYTTKKRNTTPIIGLYNPVHTGATTYCFSTSVAQGTVSARLIGDTGFSMIFTGLSNNYAYGIRWTADAEIY